MRRAYLYVGRLAHPLYREQMHAAPAGWTYLPSHPDLRDEDRLKRDLAHRSARGERARVHATRAGVAALSRAGWLRHRRVAVPDGTDLIHSGQILLRADRPYVVDCEVGHVFTFYQRGGLERPWTRALLARELTGERCCFILPWTDAAREGFLTAMGDAATAEVRARIRTVPLAIRPQVEAPKRRSGGPLRVLFVGSTFLGKGGPEALRAVETVRTSHDVELDLVSVVPEAWRGTVSAAPGVRAHETLPPAAIRRLYAECDVLLFPAHVDTLGWVAFEAQAHGVPVLGTDHFAVPEIVADEVSGLLVAKENSLFGDDRLPRFRWFHGTRFPQPFTAALAAPSEDYVHRLAAALARFAEEAGLVERLSAGALERVRTGALSIERRGALLADIYRECA